ncbi:MAG TPA: hypothetical protein VKD45_13955 [Hyphomicrobiaceae bacterium]|nr:hypothetical protein [Hyphomicrobiaceae bacterium]
MPAAVFYLIVFLVGMLLGAIVLMIVAGRSLFGAVRSSRSNRLC